MNPPGDRGLRLDFYGTRVQVDADDDRLLTALRGLAEDFAAFVQPHAEGAPQIQMSLCARAPAPRSSFFLFKTRMCRVYGLGGRRTCLYVGGTASTATSEGGRRAFVIGGADLDEVYEVAYATLLSSVGEAMEVDGYARFHALGVEFRGRAWLAVLPSGGGKSAMGYLLARRPDREFRLFSDEIVLVKRGVAYSFPIRQALGADVAGALGADVPALRVFKRSRFPSKVLIPVPVDRVAPPAEVGGVFFGAGGVLSFFASSVIGLGLPQMAENLLRADSVARIAKMALTRGAESLRLAWKGRVGSVTLTADARQNLRAFEGRLRALSHDDR